MKSTVLIMSKLSLSHRIGSWLCQRLEIARSSSVDDLTLSMNSPYLESNVGQLDIGAHYKGSYTPRSERLRYLFVKNDCVVQDVGNITWLPHIEHIITLFTTSFQFLDVDLAPYLS